MAAELNAKRLELLRDIVPGLRRVAIIANPEHPGSQIERTYSEETAQKLGLETEFFSTATEDQLTAAFGAMDPRPPQAISLFADGFAIQYRQRTAGDRRDIANLGEDGPLSARNGASACAHLRSRPHATQHSAIAMCRFSRRRGRLDSSAYLPLFGRHVVAFAYQGASQKAP
jgi:hypothetical protein